MHPKYKMVPPYGLLPLYNPIPSGTPLAITHDDLLVTDA